MSKQRIHPLDGYRFGLVQFFHYGNFFFIIYQDEAFSEKTSIWRTKQVIDVGLEELGG
jgi:hypothetical protein